MKLRELSQQLALEVQTAKEKFDTEVTGGYASDLLSWVMAKAQTGNVWITIQAHPNIVAVASLIGLSGIIIAEGVAPEAATLEKAEQEGILIMTTPLPVYVVAGKMFELGVG